MKYGLNLLPLLGHVVHVVHFKVTVQGFGKNFSFLTITTVSDDICRLGASEVEDVEVGLYAGIHILGMARAFFTAVKQHPLAVFQDP